MRVRLPDGGKRQVVLPFGPPAELFRRTMKSTLCRIVGPIGPARFQHYRDWRASYAMVACNSECLLAGQRLSLEMLLYSNSYNSGGERVRIAMALKGIEYEYVSIKEIGWDAYRSINPQALLPTLVVGDALLTQSTAILEFLEETYPQPPLLPPDRIVRALARAFAQAIASEMHAIDVGRVRRFSF